MIKEVYADNKDDWSAVYTTLRYATTTDQIS